MELADADTKRVALEVRYSPPVGRGDHKAAEAGVLALGEQNDFGVAIRRILFQGHAQFGKAQARRLFRQDRLGQERDESKRGKSDKSGTVEGWFHDDSGIR